VQSTLSTITAAHGKFARLFLTPIIWLNLKAEKDATVGVYYFITYSSPIARTYHCHDVIWLVFFLDIML
jgi:hypothetical protein